MRIVRRHEADAREQRFKRRAIVLVRRNRQRSERTAVKRFFQRDDLRTWLATGVPIAAGKLQTRFDRFGSAVAEECPRQTREIGQALGKLSLKRMKEEIRSMNQRLGLLGDWVGKRLTGMAQGSHPEPGKAVQ